MRRRRRRVLLTVKAAAARLDCQPRTVRAAFHAGKLDGVRLRKLIRIYWPPRRPRRVT